MARAYGVSQGWVSRLVARYREEGEAAFAPRSRRPKTSPRAIQKATVTLITGLRKELARQGLDREGAADHRLAPGTPPPHPGVPGDGQPLPSPGRVSDARAEERPRSSYLRFAAEQPNECWQSDFMHWQHPSSAPETIGRDVCVVEFYRLRV